jgi:hypothetical protein
MYSGGELPKIDAFDGQSPPNASIFGDIPSKINPNMA